MKHKVKLNIVAMLMIAVLGCGPKVMVPPRIDLTQHEMVGIIEFKCANEGELGPYATKKFIEEIRRDQGMVRIVDLGNEAEVLKEIGYKKMDQEAYKAIGEKFEVSTIFSGELVVSDVRPDITITPWLGYMSFAAEVDAKLDAQMVETSSGASIWSNSSDATQRVSHVSIFGGEFFSFDAEDPDESYGKLIISLVEKASEDFRVSWRRE